MRLASLEMRALIAIETAGADRLGPVDFYNAAVHMRSHLGISTHAWTEALDVMGPDSSWLAVFLLDANRDHPETPVRNPGGALRAMTRRSAEGRLNLLGSLIRLARRREAEARVEPCP
ncbi:replication initiation protein RepC [Palleronia caenipelagi]|nr:replication initiation protein RepC [Palleronia caenipelagi]